MSFNQLLKQGLLVTFISKYSSIIIQLVVGMVLARLLTPSEFGIFAIIMVFTAFFSLMSDIGIAPAIIQSKDVNKKDVLNYFYISILMGLTLSGLFIALSFLLVKFYSNEVYIKLGYILSISIFFSSIGIIPSALLSKAKKFKVLGILKFSAALISGAIAIILAYKNFSYYSLVAQSIIYAVVIFLGSYLLSDFSVFLKKKRTSLSDIKLSLRKIISYSSYNFAFNFINYFSRNLDNILIGKYLGASSLGFYDKSYRLMLFPISSLNQVFSPILHPLLADYQDNKEFIFQTFFKMVRILALIGIPLTIFFYYNATDIIVIMYGNQWYESIPIFRILSLTVWIQIIVASMGAIFLASNKPNLYFFNGLINAVILVIAIVLGILEDSLIQLSIYLMIGYYLSSFVSFYLIMVHVFNKKLILLYKLLLNPLIVGLLIILILQLNLLFKVDNSFIRLIINLILSFVGFAIGIFVTREYKFLIRVITKN